MLTQWWPSMRLIEDANITEPGTVPVRLKGRGIVVHRRARVPSTSLYEIKPGLWVGHPSTIRAFERAVQEEMVGSIDEISRVTFWVSEAAEPSVLNYEIFAEAARRVEEVRLAASRRRSLEGEVIE